MPRLHAGGVRGVGVQSDVAGCMRHPHPQEAALLSTIPSGTLQMCMPHSASSDRWQCHCRSLWVFAHVAQAVNASSGSQRPAIPRMQGSLNIHADGHDFLLRFRSLPKVVVDLACAQLGGCSAQASRSAFQLRVHDARSGNATKLKPLAKRLPGEQAKGGVTGKSLSLTRLGDLLIEMRPQFWIRALGCVQKSHLHGMSSQLIPPGLAAALIRSVRADVVPSLRSQGLGTGLHWIAAFQSQGYWACLEIRLSEGFLLGTLWDQEPLPVLHMLSACFPSLGSPSVRSCTCRCFRSKAANSLQRSRVSTSHPWADSLPRQLSCSVQVPGDHACVWSFHRGRPQEACRPSDLKRGA